MRATIFALFVLAACNPVHTGTSTPVGSDADPPTRALADEVTPQPTGLHHLSEACVLDEAGTLHCYGASPSSSTSTLKWLREVPGVPKLETLARSSPTEWQCGRGVDGGLVCVDDYERVYRAEVPGGLKEVPGHFAVSQSGERFLIERRPDRTGRASTLSLASLEQLSGYSQVLSAPRSGLLAVGNEGSKLITLARDCRTIEECLGPDAEELALPFLDGRDDLVDVVVLADNRGCVLGQEGSVECWDERGRPAGRKHGADGRGRALAHTNFDSGEHGFCVATEDEVVCEDFDAPTKTNTLPVSGVHELSSHNGSLCGLDGESGMVCLRTGLWEQTLRRVEGLPPAKSIARSKRGWCAVSKDDALWCWGAPFSTDEPTTVGGHASDEQPLRAPTELVSSGVERFEFGKHGNVWCVSQGGTARWQGLRNWSFDLPSEAKLLLVEAQSKVTYWLEEGALRWTASDRPVPPELAATAGQGSIDAASLLSADDGCVARGEKVSCWGGPETFVVPGPVAALVKDPGALYAHLEDGRVYFTESGDAAQPYPELSVRGFRQAATSRGWCAVEDAGVVCGAREELRRYPWPGAISGDFDGDGGGCLLDGKGEVYCRGDQRSGETGHGWSPFELVRVPMHGAPLRTGK